MCIYITLKICVVTSQMGVSEREREREGEREREREERVSVCVYRDCVQ